jgi:hypothetical protein
MSAGVSAIVAARFGRDVAARAAEPYGDQVVFPDQTRIDEVGDPGRLFPGWPGPVLVLSVENQGVCAWGVLVGGELVGSGEATVRYARSIEEYVAVRAWDSVCLAPVPLVQAQAAPVEAATIERLNRSFSPAIATSGWPGAEQLRFQRRGVRIMLWSAQDQCDWWISGPLEEVRSALEEVATLSDLLEALWSNDEQGVMLLSSLGIGHP